MAIRKIPRKLRFGHGDLVKSDYAPESIITLLENCVTAHLSTVIGDSLMQERQNFLSIWLHLFRQKKRLVFMRIIRRYITGRLIHIASVLSFLWILRLHIRIL